MTIMKHKWSLQWESCSLTNQNKRLSITFSCAILLALFGFMQYIQSGKVLNLLQCLLASQLTMHLFVEINKIISFKGRVPPNCFAFYKIATHP